MNRFLSYICACNSAKFLIVLVTVIVNLKYAYGLNLLKLGTGQVTVAVLCVI